MQDNQRSVRARYGNPTAARGHTTFLDLPSSILQRILLILAEDTSRTSGTLFHVARSCKRLRTELAEASAVWESAWDAWTGHGKGRRREFRQDRDRPRDVGAREWLRLLCHCGCLCCGRQGLHEVLWPLKVRCCKACKASHVIPGRELRELGLDPNLLVELPHMDTTAYRRTKRGNSVSNLTSYWRCDVDRLLQQAGTGVTMADLQAERDLSKAQLMHAAKERQAKANFKRVHMQRRREEMAAYIAAKAPELHASAEELERADAFRLRLAVDGRLRLTPNFLHQIIGQVLASRVAAAVAEAERA